MAVPGTGGIVVRDLDKNFDLRTIFLRIKIEIVIEMECDCELFIISHLHLA